MEKKFKIISEDLQKNLIEFLDEVQFDAATDGSDVESMQKIDFCNWAIKELLDSYMTDKLVWKVNFRKTLI